MAGLTRRTLLKAGLAGLSSFALWPPSPLSRQEAAALCSQRVSLYTGRVSGGIPTTCGLCGAGCGLLAFVEEGGLVGLAGHPSHPYNRGSLCCIGSAGMNLQTSTRRILKPLRRRGGRGEGSWEEIGWEEALEELATQFENVRAGTGGRSLVIAVPGREDSHLSRRFLKALGNGILAQTDGWDRPAEAQVWSSFAGGVAAAPDLANASLVLNFGADPLGSPRRLVGAGRQWAEAAARGSRWTTLDPRLSATAARSERWIPLRPGTDGFVALAIANEILRRGWADRAFLEAQTDGSLETLRRVLSAWPCARVASLAGVPSSTIETMAAEFAGAERAVAIFGSGVTSRAGGVESARAVLLLDLLTGRMGKKGGLWVPARFRWQEPDPALPERQVPILAGTLAPDIEGGKVKVGCLLSLQADPAGQDPGGRRTAEVLRSPERVPYHAALASSWNETARLADLVLPSATYLESWGIAVRSDFEPGRILVSLRQPVLDPPEGARSPDGLLLELAGRLGGGLAEAFPLAHPGEYYRLLLSQTFGDREDLAWEALRARGFALVDTGPVGPSAGREHPGLLRIGPTMEQAAARLAHLYNEKARGERPGKTLILFSAAPRGNDVPCSKWLSEIDHADPLWVHPSAAHELGCGEGDRVTVTGPGGEIVTRVRLTEGIHPEAVAMASSPLPEPDDLSEEDPDRKLVWWKGKSYHARARSLVAWPADPEQAAPGWMDTLVTIKRDGQ
ncbi:MAG: molybdopterin-dependent oxidoreductase [bacterium]